MTKERIARWTIYVLLSIGIAYIGVDLACLEISDNCTYYEVQALINNRTELIGFAWLWAVMLIISDFGMGIKERSANVVIQKTLCLSIALVVFFHIVVLIVCILSSKNSALLFENKCTYENELLMKNISPVAAVCISALLIFLRTVFTILLMYLLNQRMKFAYGVVIPFIMFLFDWLFYYITRTSEPLRLLPVEHTRIFYTEAMAPNWNEVPRFSYWISIAYWIILIAMLCFYIFRNRKTGHRLTDTHTIHNIGLGEWLINKKGYFVYIVIFLMIAAISALNNLRVDYGVPTKHLGWINIFRYAFVERCVIGDILNPLLLGCMYFSFIQGKNSQGDFVREVSYTFLNASSLMLIVQIIIAVIAVIISPYKAVTIPYHGSFQQLFNKSKYLFVAVYITYVCVASGLLSCITACIYEFTNNSALSILIPSFGITTYIPSSWLWGSLLTTIIPDAPLSAGNYFAPVWKRILDLIILTAVIVVCIYVRKKSLEPLRS